MSAPTLNPMCTNRGFSLVELMVGIVIALLGTLVIFQVFSVSEGYKRTTTSGGDAQQNGTLALFTLEREIRHAGYGVNNPTYLGCQVIGYDAGPPVRDPINFSLIPLQITQGTDNDGTGQGKDSDTITTMHGNSQLKTSGVTLYQTMLAPDSYFMLSNQYGFLPGDLVIAAEPGQNCTLAEVTSTDQNKIFHDTGNYTNNNGVVTTARYNKAGGLGITYTTNGMLFDLGPNPVVNVFTVNNSQLSVANSLAISAATTVADGIVNVQAQYGKDTDNDQIVDTWDFITPANAAGWLQILAVRVAVVARSGLREKTNAAGVCDTTTTAPVWDGGIFDLSADPDWQCYRYKTFQTTVPLRNMIWRPE